MSKKVKILMENYFADQAIGRPMIKISHDLPIKAREGKWLLKNDPEKFYKVFSFDDRRRLTDFINEVLDFEDTAGHHGNISIDHLNVIIEIFTKDLNRVTNQDQEYCRSVDDIFEDCSYYEYG